jgi:hypothetical protein
VSPLRSAAHPWWFRLFNHCSTSLELRHPAFLNVHSFHLSIAIRLGPVLAFVCQSLHFLIALRVCLCVVLIVVEVLHAIRIFRYVVISESFDVRVALRDVLRLIRHGLSTTHETALSCEPRVLTLLLVAVQHRILIYNTALTNLQGVNARVVPKFLSLFHGIQALFVFGRH